MADAGWRGASGSGRDCTCSGRAGEVRQGSEAKGNAGRVEVRQAWSGCSGRDCSGLTGSGWLRQARIDAAWAACPEGYG